MRNADLQVEQLSSALQDAHLDVVISGSIGAVESVRFVRALRRLGAEVYPVLTSGGAQFVTDTALSWAAARSITANFSGENSHIAARDACIIAPASADFIGKLAAGVTDNPGLALAASYLGQNKPLIVIPNMHESLFVSPIIAKNIETLKQHAIVLKGRTEEGKQKFPESKVLADQIAHIVNSSNQDLTPVVISLGGTKAYLDDVRYISNYSSGRLGSFISEELYRWGHKVHVVVGSALHQPETYTTLTKAETNAEMLAAIIHHIDGGVKRVVLAASVLDYEPDAVEAGKVKSNRPEWQVSFKPTQKIIAEVAGRVEQLVGFKLETELSHESAEKIAQEYSEKYSLSMLVMNQLKDVSESQHKALIFRSDQTSDHRWLAIDGKRELAHFIAKHIHDY